MKTTDQHLNARRPLTHHFALLVITCIIILIHTHSSVFDTLTYSRFDIKLGQWWRFMTGGFTHSNMWHLGLNLVVLWLLYFLFDSKYHTVKALALLILCNLSVNICLWYGSVETYYYLGLSGTLHALFSFGALRSTQKTHSGWLLYAAGCFKIFAEQHGWLADNLSQTLIATPIHYDAHAYGFIIGTVYGLISILYIGIKRKQSA